MDRANHPPHVPRRPPTTWMTSLDGYDHAVTEMLGTSGLYEAACGLRVLPEASQEPPYPRCTGCARFVHSWHEAYLRQRRRSIPRKRGFFRRLWCRNPR